MTIAIKDNARLNVRLTPDIKERIEKAAVVTGKTVTEFAVNALSRIADEILDQHHATKLSDRDRDMFLTMLDKPAKPNSALKRAAKTHKRLIVK